MPLQNRVTPLGELITHPGRGLVYGNRGCLHDEQGRIRRRWATKRWIACRLKFRGWHREPLMQPGKFTELFFLDEATALAAGHRPCALCRHEDYVRFGELWGKMHPGRIGADAIDGRLHEERMGGPHEIVPADGAFVLREGDPWLVLGSSIRRWTPAGYADALPRPKGRMVTITPPSLVSILRAGWSGAVPLLHPSARSERHGFRASLTASSRFPGTVTPMAGNKRQTFGKMQRERERLEKRARKQAKKEEKKIAAAADAQAEALGYYVPRDDELEPEALVGRVEPEDAA